MSKSNSKQTSRKVSTTASQVLRDGRTSKKVSLSLAAPYHKQDQKSKYA